MDTMNSGEAMPAVAQEAVPARRIQEISPTLMHAMRENVAPEQPFHPEPQVQRQVPTTFFDKLRDFARFQSPRQTKWESYTPEPDPDLVAYNKAIMPAGYAHSEGRREISQFFLDASAQSGEEGTLTEAAVEQILNKRQQLTVALDEVRVTFTTDFNGAQIDDFYFATQWPTAENMQRLQESSSEQLSRVYDYVRLIGERQTIELIVTELILANKDNLAPALEAFIDQDRQRLLELHAHFEESVTRIGLMVNDQIVRTPGNKLDPQGWMLRGFDASKTTPGAVLAFVDTNNNFELDYGPTYPFNDPNKAGVSLHMDDETLGLHFNLNGDTRTTRLDFTHGPLVSTREIRGGETVNQTVEDNPELARVSEDPIRDLRYGQRTMKDAIDLMDGILEGRYIGLIMGVSRDFTPNERAQLGLEPEDTAPDTQGPFGLMSYTKYVKRPFILDPNLPQQESPAAIPSPET